MRSVSTINFGSKMRNYKNMQIFQTRISDQIERIIRIHDICLHNLILKIYSAYDYLIKIFLFISRSLERSTSKNGTSDSGLDSNYSYLSGSTPSRFNTSASSSTYPSASSSTSVPSSNSYSSSTTSTSAPFGITRRDSSTSSYKR